MSAGSARDRITCPHCQGSLKAPPLPAGSLCTCPKCGQSFPIGQPVKAAASTPAVQSAAVAKPSPVAPKPKPPASIPPPDVPVRAELADPKPTLVSPAKPPAMAPVVTVSDDDVIGQMLLGDPVSSTVADRPRMPAPAPVAPVRQKSPPPQLPAPAPAADPQQDRQLRTLLSAPAAVSAPARRDARLATVTTQPAHQQNVTPPAPVAQPAAPKRTKTPELPVVCKLCGTRMYARPEQVGTKVRCPDCHSENEVLATQTPVAKTVSPPSLDAEGDFTLSEPGDRPAYRPMVEPRGDYEALAHLDRTAPPRRPDEQPQPRAISTDMTMTLSQAAMDDDDGEEIIVSAPVERIDVKETVKLPPPDDPDEDNQYRGRFRDEEWGFIGNPHGKDAWKKSPFYFGILGFLFYPQTLMRLVLYSFFLTIDLTLFLAAIFFARDVTPLLYAALALTVSSSILSVFILGGALPCLVAITQDTANGSDAVESWPDWNIAEWLFQALTIPAAAFLAALPGSIITSGLFALGRNGILLSPYPLLLSELIFFPIIFGSMLAENSLMPVSGAILRSMQQRGDGWMLFYGMSVLLGMMLAASMALVEVGVQLHTVLIAPFAAVLWVLAIILYFRLLGRLLWYVQNYRRERDRPQ